MDSLNTEISEICFNLWVKFVSKTVKTWRCGGSPFCVHVPSGEDFIGYEDNVWINFWIFFSPSSYQRSIFPPISNIISLTKT